MAETVTLAVAHAFGTAYEAWRIMPSTKEFTSKENERNNINQKEERGERHRRGKTNRFR
jgi:hypothetical protein